MAHLFQQLNRFLQFLFLHVGEQLLTQGDDRFVQISEQGKALAQNSYRNDSAIGFRPGPAHQALFFQPVDEAGDGRHDGDHAVSDFEDGEGLTRAPKYTKHVILLRRDAMLPKESGVGDLDMIGGPLQIEQGFLGGRGEPLILLYFEL